MLEFQRVIWISKRPWHINWWSGNSAIFKLSWYFCRKCISFVEIVTVMRTLPPGPLKLNRCPGRLLDVMKKCFAVVTWRWKSRLATSQPHEFLGKQSKLFKSRSGQGSRWKGQVTGNLFLRLGQLGFSCWKLISAIFRKYPAPSIIWKYFHFYWVHAIETHIFKQYYGLCILCKTSKFIVYRLVSERTRQVVIEQTQFLSTPFLCSEFKLENIYSGVNFCQEIAGKIAKIRTHKNFVPHCGPRPTLQIWLYIFWDLITYHTRRWRKNQTD